MTPAERYLELCLRLRRLNDELLDSYYGPDHLAERVESEIPRPAGDLVSDAQAISAEAETEYLRAQLRGLEIVARKLAGETIGYAEEVRRCYALEAKRTPEERFSEAHEVLEQALPPDGSLPERYQSWSRAGEIPADKILPVVEALTARLRERTADLVGLPEGESIELELVSGEHWSAYNYYLGGLRSRVSINTDIPVRAGTVAHLVAHELYPGHHTELAWKEQALVRDRGLIEETVQMYGTPQCVISEGIAELSAPMAVDDQDELTAEVLAEQGIEYDAVLGRQIREAREQLDRVPNNAALLIHQDGASREEAKAYLQRWWLVDEERAGKMVSFVADPIGGPYITTYTDGYDLCRDWVGGDAGRFKRLLTEQLTPADLVG